MIQPRRRSHYSGAFIFEAVTPAFRGFPSNRLAAQHRLSYAATDAAPIDVMLYKRLRANKIIDFNALTNANSVGEHACFR
jgi:hypothetical protein